MTVSNKKGTWSNTEREFMSTAPKFSPLLKFCIAFCLAPPNFAFIRSRLTCYVMEARHEFVA